MALTVTGPLKPARAVTVKDPLVTPAASVMVFGSDKRLLLLLRSTILDPPAGVGPFMVTVQTAVLSAAKTEGVQATDEGGGHPTLTAVLCAIPLNDAVRLTAANGTCCAVAANVTLAAPAGIETLAGVERLVALLLAIATVSAAAVF